MAQDNLEILRTMLDAFDRRDRAAWLEVRHPETEVVPAMSWVEVDVVIGREAAWDYYVATMSAFEDVSFADNHTAEATSPDDLLVHNHANVRGRASGAGVDLDLWVLVTFRDGMVVRERWFRDEDEARRAAGSR